MHKLVLSSLPDWRPILRVLDVRHVKGCRTIQVNTAATMPSETDEAGLFHLSDR